MGTFAVAMVKDEADIIAATVTRMLDQVDEVLIADNGSTDGTREILADLPVTVIDDPEPAYYQSRKMTALAHRAADAGAEWVVPFDADEVWYSPFGRVADVLRTRASDAIVTAELYDHVPTGVDPDESDPTRRIGWRRTSPAPLPKVACRAVARVTIRQGNHSAGYPHLTTGGLLVVRHFPYRSPEQMIRKARNGAAAYAATDLPEHEGQHWRDYGRLSDEQLADVFRQHFWTADPVAADLIYDPAP